MEYYTSVTFFPRYFFWRVLLDQVSYDQQTNATTIPVLIGYEGTQTIHNIYWLGDATGFPVDAVLADPVFMDSGEPVEGDFPAEPVVPV